MGKDLIHFLQFSVTIANKMELLQSQAPVDWELSGSSTSARQGTSNNGHQTRDVGHGTWDIEIWKY